jgi:enoyl-CoA hydratase/carnithine racemase
MIDTEDAERVRVLTLDRPAALNAFDEALYHATADALAAAGDDPHVAVLVLTGAGRAFSAGQDVKEMAQLAAGEFEGTPTGFQRLVAALRGFPKPLLCAVNGMALGIGATLLAYADLVLMSTEARVRVPFTDLAVAPEAGSSLTFPRLLGRQDATWMLLSSEWFSAEQCHEMGLAWRVVAPDDLLEETLRHARVLASKPIDSLVATKRTIVAGLDEGVDAASQREIEEFQRLLGSPANLEAFTALAERRPPDFVAVDERTAREKETPKSGA